MLPHKPGPRSPKISPCWIPHLCPPSPNLLSPTPRTPGHPSGPQCSSPSASLVLLPVPPAPASRTLFSLLPPLQTAKCCQSPKSQPCRPTTHTARHQYTVMTQLNGIQPISSSQ